MIPTQSPMPWFALAIRPMIPKIHRKNHTRTKTTVTGLKI